MSAMSAIAAAAAFRAAFERRDFAPAAAVLAEDVAFRSPVLAEPWRTRPVLERLGPAMVGIFEDMAFGVPLVEGSRAMLPFTARQGTADAEGVLALDVDGDGRVAHLAILVRPLPALIAVAKAMQQRVDPALLAGHG